MQLCEKGDKVVFLLKIYILTNRVFVFMVGIRYCRDKACLVSTNDIIKICPLRRIPPRPAGTPPEEGNVLR